MRTAYSSPQEMTREMGYLAIIVALIEYLYNTGIVSTAIYSGVMAVSILFVYALFCRKRGGIEIVELFPLLIVSSFVVLNRDLSNFSLGLMWILFFIFSKSKVQCEKVLKKYAFAAIISYLITSILFFVIGFNSTSNMLMWRNNHFITRLSLGFVQPNFAMMSFLGIVVALLYVYRNIVRRVAIILFLLTIPIFILTQSRTSGYIIFLLLIICIIFPRKIKNVVSETEMMTLSAVPIILLIFSYYLVKVPVNLKINDLLSGRLVLYQSIYENFGIHLVGNSLAKATMLDNSYLQSLIAKGLLFTIFLFGSYVYIFFVKKQEVSRLCVLVILSYFLIAFTETSFFRFIVLFPVLTVVISMKKREKEVFKEFEGVQKCIKSR